MKFNNETERIHTFEEYRQCVDETSVHPAYPDRGANLMFPVVGLNEEAGEFAGQFKRLVRDRGWSAGEPIPDDVKEAMIAEAGDVLWYLQQAAHELGTTLDHIAYVNISKLASRKERGVLGGSGDKR